MSFNAIIWAMRAQTESPTAKLILIALADRANEKGECFPSLQTISNTCEMTRRSTINGINKLESMGLVKVQRRKTKGLNKSSVYSLNFSSEKISPLVVKKFHYPSEKISPPVVKKFHPNQSIESVNESLPFKPPDKNGAGNPSFSEISSFCKKSKSLVDPQEFFNHYNLLDWKISGDPIRDWKSLLLSWNNGRKEGNDDWEDVELPFGDS